MANRCEIQSNPKPDHLRNRHSQQEPEEDEECEYLEPIQKHWYEEPTYIDMQTDQPDDEGACELIGSMENLE